MYGLILPVADTPPAWAGTLGAIVSALYHEDSLGGVVIVADGKPSYTVLQALARIEVPVEVAQNPRAGRGDGWKGGLVVGMLEALRVASTFQDIDFWLKLDDDARVVAPFSRRIMRFLEQKAVGQIGCFRYTSSGVTRAIGPIRKYMLGLLHGIRPSMTSVWPLDPTVWPTAEQAHRIRSLIKIAQSHGYRLGEHCHGGAYALKPSAIEQIVAEVSETWTCSSDWLSSDLGEDVVITMLVQASGFRILDSYKTNDVFSIASGTLEFHPQEILKNGNSIVHSVRSYGDLRSREILRQFRAMGALPPLALSEVRQ